MPNVEPWAPRYKDEKQFPAPPFSPPSFPLQANPEAPPAEEETEEQEVQEELAGEQEQPAAPTPAAGASAKATRGNKAAATKTPSASSKKTRQQQPEEEPAAAGDADAEDAAGDTEDDYDFDNEANPIVTWSIKIRWNDEDMPLEILVSARALPHECSRASLHPLPSQQQPTYCSLQKILSKVSSSSPDIYVYINSRSFPRATDGLHHVSAEGDHRHEDGQPAAPGPAAHHLGGAVRVECS